MSDDNGAAHGDMEIPVSSGLPKSLLVFAILSILIIFGQGTAVVVASNFGKVFPAANSTKCKLPAPNTMSAEACPNP